MFSRRNKVLRVMGLLALHCTELREDSPVSEVSTNTLTHRQYCLVNGNAFILLELMFNVEFHSNSSYSINLFIQPLMA